MINKKIIILLSLNYVVNSQDTSRSARFCSWTMTLVATPTALGKAVLMAELIAPGSDTVDADEDDESEEEDDAAAFFFAATPPFWMKGIM